MEELELIQPDRCLIGGSYYLKSTSNDKGSQLRRVTFISYRPHPAEVIVDDGRGPRLAYRLDLYQNGNLDSEKAGNSSGDEKGIR